jgi:amino acid transporter
MTTHQTQTELDKKIGLSTVWAIGVGAAIGGDFFGWEMVYSGGFFSALICMTFCALFYWLFAGVLMELASRYKSSGGSFDFTSVALGKKRAVLMAVLVLSKLILANCATGLAVSSYLSDIGYPKKLQV